MRTELAFLLLLFSYTSLAQSSYQPLRVNIPEVQTASTDSIAAYINQHYFTDKEKCLAIYSWVTSNIKYDTDSMYHINWSLSKTASVREALRRRKGVCENFAGIFNEITNKAGVIAFVVDGYTSQSGTLDKSGHSWNAVQLDSVWLLCDPTWDKDAVYNFRYFLVTPEQFILEHMPFDPMWQLLYDPVSKETFAGFRSRSSKTFYNYPDSIKLFSSLNDTAKLAFTARHLQETGSANELSRNRIALVNMHLGILNEEKDRNNYNYLVNTLNDAIKMYNEYITQFNDGIKNNDSLIRKASGKINTALKELSVMDIRHPQYDLSTLRVRLLDMQEKILTALPLK